MRLCRTAAACALAAALSIGCDSGNTGGSTTSRFASAGGNANAKSAAAFCERQWPATVGARKFAGIPERTLAGAPAAPPARNGAWKWVNLWATWCLPCLEEMTLLGRWKSTLEKDGIAVDLELWSVDEEEAKLKEYIETTNMPGRVRWLRAQEDLPAVLESLGADRNTAIPVHALIDGAGNLRCLRVGSVHDEDYGAVKSLLSTT